MNEITQPAAREYEWSGGEGKRRKKVVFVDWFIASNDILKYEKRSFVNEQFQVLSLVVHHTLMHRWAGSLWGCDKKFRLLLIAPLTFKVCSIEHFWSFKHSQVPSPNSQTRPNFSEKLNEIKVSVCVAEKLNNNYSMPQWSWNSSLHEWNLAGLLLELTNLCLGHGF